MSQGQQYESIGVNVGTDNDSGQALIGLLFETETTTYDGEFDERYVSIASAKSLLIDLRDAIEAAEKVQRGEDPEE